MPRTTVDIDNTLIKELKHLAAERKESMSKTLNRLVHDALQRVRGESEVPRSIEWHVAAGGSPAPGFDPATREYMDLLDDE